MALPSYTVYWRGFPCCPCLKAWLIEYEIECLRAGVIKKNLDIYQLIGGAAASAGYHLYGGNEDDGQVSTTALRIARNMGNAKFPRDYRDGMTTHGHGVLKGCPHIRSGPRWQITELEAGRNGLTNRRADRGPRSGIKWPLRSYTAGIAWAKANRTPTFIPHAWYVCVDRLYPHTEPDINSPVGEGYVTYGRRLWITKTEVRYGTLWGRTLLNRWWILGGGRCSKTPPPVRYWVIVDELTAHAEPNVKSAKLPNPVGYGRRLDIHDTKNVWGTVWGYTLASGVKRWWPLTRRTSKTPPPTVADRSVPVGFAEVATWNLAAQSTGHNTTFRSVRCPSAVRRLAASKIDVAMVQETGSGLYLDALDAELAANGDGITRVNGGSNWRHILRDTDTTKWVASTTITLPTGTDSDGSQIALAVVEVAGGVKAGFCSGHFDVGASAAVHAQQAEETWQFAMEWFLTRDVAPINVSIGIDGNDNTGAVLAVFAKYGFINAVDVAEQTINAELKTNNKWSTTPVLLGDKSPLDVLLVHEDVQVTDWQNIWDAETSDHNIVSAIRGYYA